MFGNLLTRISAKSHNGEEKLPQNINSKQESQAKVLKSSMKVHPSELILVESSTE